MKYDVIIIGAGPGGIFSAYELTKENPDLKIAVFEAGLPPPPIEGFLPALIPFPIICFLRYFRPAVLLQGHFFYSIST